MASRQRIRAKISKTDSARYMSHLDFMRTFERALRRSSLPITYTEGYNPHPKFSLATALPVGYSSVTEIGDFFLDRYVDPYEFARIMNEQLPPGVSILATSCISLNSPALASLPQSSVYDAFLGAAARDEDLQNRVEGFLARESVQYVRRPKEMSGGGLGEDEEENAGAMGERGAPNLDSQKTPPEAGGKEPGSRQNGVKGVKNDASAKNKKTIDLKKAVLSLKVTAPGAITMWVIGCRPEEVLESLDLEHSVRRLATITKTHFYVKPRDKWLDPMEFDTLPGFAGRAKWGM